MTGRRRPRPNDIWQRKEISSQNARRGLNDMRNSRHLTRLRADEQMALCSPLASSSGKWTPTRNICRENVDAIFSENVQVILTRRINICFNGGVRALSAGASELRRQHVAESAAFKEAPRSEAVLARYERSIPIASHFKTDLASAYECGKFSDSVRDLIRKKKVLLQS